MLKRLTPQPSKRETPLGAEKSCSNSTSLTAEPAWERFRAFPGTAALDLQPRQRPAQSPITGNPASGNTRTPPRIRNLFDSSNPRLCGLRFPSGWRCERQESQNKQGRTSASILAPFCVECLSAGLDDAEVKAANALATLLPVELLQGREQSATRRETRKRKVLTLP